MPGTNDASVATCLKVVRAAFARTLSQAYDIPFADPQKAQEEDLVGQPHLSFVDFSQLGYPMGDSLVPLINMVTGDPNAPDDAQSVGITAYDQLLDETKADLHDRLLNLSPKFDLSVSLDFSNAVLNTVYEEMLRTAQFAGGVETQDAEAIAAREFLFPVNANGLPEKSAAYIKYEDYSLQMDALMLEIAEAQLTKTPEEVRVLELRKTRLEAEWRTLGQKSKIEEMLQRVINADKGGGFEDERVRFQEILEARTRDRISSALTYAAVKIAPLSAITDTDANSFWSEIQFDAEALRRAVDPEARLAFDVSLQELDQTCSMIRNARFSHTRITLNREWLQDEFLHARYWRHPTKLLSDGKGGGDAPTVATSAIFVRNAGFEIDLGLSAEQGTQVKTGRVRIAMQAQKETPLIKMLAQDQSKLVQKRKLKPADAKVQKEHLGKLLKNRTLEKKKLDRFNTKKIKQGNLKSLDLSKLIKPAKIFSPIMMSQPSVMERGVVQPARVVQPAMRMRVAQPVRITGTTARAASGRVRVAPRGPAAPPPRTAQANILTLSGLINVDGDITDRDIVLTVDAMASQRVMSTKTLPLQRDGSGNLRFSHKLNQRFVQAHATAGRPATRRVTGLTAARLTLRDIKGPSLLTQEIAFGSRSRHEVLNWMLSEQVAEFDLAAQVDPTLMAYGLELLPACPNPSDEFSWD